MVYPLSLLIVVLGLGYLLFTLALSRKKKPLATGGIEPQRFIFIVPALNEELVIGTTVDGLLQACSDADRVLVVDDGSTDATAEIVRSRMADPRVLLYQRTLPDAKVGKGKALNAVYRQIRADVVAEGIDPRDVVLCIVDADGRVEPTVLDTVAPYFRDPRMGAVQLLVRIRNRERWLTRFQDYEFLLFSALTQTAREKLGSVGLGGNGQFTRLAALMDLGDDPWSECLTEDLDLGVRLAIAGWLNRFCGEAYVDQQGLTSMRLLIRQRTRWAQGHFQCWKLVPKVLASQLPTVTAFDMCYYLLSPGLVLIAPVLFTVTFLLFAAGVVAHPESWLTPYGMVFAAFEYVMTFAPALWMAFMYWRRAGDLSLFKAFVMGHLLAAYNYIWYIAEYKAVARILLRRNGWSKTARSAEVDSPAGAVIDDGPLTEVGGFWGADGGFWDDTDTEQAQSAYVAYRDKYQPAPAYAGAASGQSQAAAVLQARAARPTEYVLRDNYDETPTQIIRLLPPVPAPKRR